MGDMSLNVEVRADSERVSLHLVRGEGLDDVPNVVAYELPSRHVLAIGETEQRVRDACAAVPDHVLVPEIGFAHPFDVDAFDWAECP